MKRLFIAVQLLAECVWTLCTDKEEQRQYEYDLGNGEIED
jgi:hypothetical protein